MKAEETKVHIQTSDLKNAIQEYQLERIAKTYADLIQDKEYNKITDFFLTDIYGAQDFGFRNNSIKSLYDKSHHFLRKDMQDAISRVIELNDLSEDLDNKLAVKMNDLKISINFKFENYQDAYRECANFKERVYQINLLVDATQKIHTLSKVWFIGASLKALHAFSEMFGLGKIMDFLYRGYEAFHSVSDIGYFCSIVYDREMKLNDQLFGL